MIWSKIKSQDSVSKGKLPINVAVVVVILLAFAALIIVVGSSIINEETDVFNKFVDRNSPEGVEGFPPLLILVWTDFLMTKLGRRPNQFICRFLRDSYGDVSAYGGLDSPGNRDLDNTDNYRQQLCDRK